MGTFLFDKIIFGPVSSRRLGVSLGINLLPVNTKWCSFDCIYCECGFNTAHTGKPVLPSREDVKSQLLEYLTKNQRSEKRLTTITFAGNGEPSLHPDFAKIINDTIDLRNHLAPGVKIAVLSNATRIHVPEVFEALRKVDENILKLDSAFENTIKLLNCPAGDFNLQNLIGHLKLFNGKLIIQTMFVKGEYKGQTFDNSSEEEIKAWLKIILEIKPSKVMVYTIARDTAATGLSKVSANKLDYIASLLEKTGIPVMVSH